MAFLASSREWISDWVHDDACRDPVEFTRHTWFMGIRLAAGLSALALMPIGLALHGIPAIWEVCAFIFALAPLASIPVLVSTGRLLPAHAVSAFGLSLAALAIAVGSSGLTGAVAVWLVLPLIEALASGSMLLLGAAGLLTFATLASAASVGLLVPPKPADPLREALLCLPALTYMVALAYGVIRTASARQNAVDVADGRYRSLVTALHDLVLEQDRGGAVLSASASGEPPFGLAARDLLGRGLFERILVQDRPALLKAVADACAHDSIATARLRLRSGQVTSGGRYEEPVFIWVELRARRMASAGGGEPRVISVVRDISLEKAREEAAARSRSEAEESMAWKDRFLANVSHELRTPLNAIIGFSEILGNPELMPKEDARRKEYADIIHSSGQHLLAVVNSILDMSKIEAGRFDVVAEPFEIAPLIEACCDILSLKAEQAGVEIRRDYPAKLEELVADKRACRQILINLLSNALKFTPRHGTVTVGVRPEGNEMVFFVADTGIGIMARDMPRLGDAFFQSSSAYDRSFEGTGLGLSVVRGLVGLHGGSITIDSTVGEGTCVTVRLPLDCRNVPVTRGAAPIQVMPRIGVRHFETDDLAPVPVKKIA